ncbi:MAG TPA: Fe(3+) ABC transporter substrate-binding protein [Noviherbaspirillum sp.]|jgi:iron(III) transport system substrate-binding protein|uniref:Fe(3+) ABC transporter substrate-binding protein n=1 Tax=Noviherbaspirillum sp. TaxID=1926288 RepID=UPI002DDCF682|nr:Fe(3+) ABC transporter substrate-binding protein [Noviherbaspirillum sp.]HEV2610541.1 Fe(3+) ABC transporter substrate-binding protein [Noviherbaspirillum sp.]
MKPTLVKMLGMAFAVAAASSAHSQENVLNLYSSRHYQTDEQLYSNFTKKTGIKINRIEAEDNPLLERLRNEGKNSPADVILMVDAARLWRAQIEGMFQPVKSKVLDSRIPDNLRGKDDGNGAEWYGFSTRGRVIVYNKETVKPEDVATYESLADPKNKGKVCTRSGSHPYMLSLIGSLIEHNGEAATEKWAQGMVTNFARPPRGGDTDQIKGVASGECGVALTNTYYYVRLLRSNKPEDKALISKVGLIWPNQKTTGAHMNISGGGVAKNAPHREAAVKFLEYLASDEAQGYFANGNNEWPVVKSATATNPELESLGKFKAENISIATIGKNQITAQRILDRVGYK